MLTLLLAPWLLLGCKPALQAPETTEEQMVFGFVNYEAEEAVGLIVDPLVAWAPLHLEELSEGYAIDALTAEDIAFVGLGDKDAGNIMGAMGHAEYEVGVADVAYGMTYENKVEFNTNTRSFDITATYGDLDCFLAGDCLAYAFDATEEACASILGVSTRDYHQEMQWVDMPDGTRILALRQASPEPMDFTTSILAVDQQYDFSIVYPTDTGARRLEAFWIDARILGDLTLPEGFAVRQAANAMMETAEEMNAWFRGDAPGESRCQKGGN